MRFDIADLRSRGFEGFIRVHNLTPANRRDLEDCRQGQLRLSTSLRPGGS